MQLTLKVCTGGGEPVADERERRFERFPVIIGRASDCDYFLDDASRYISSNHASILLEEGQLLIEDTSANGTYLNGSSEPLGRDQRTLLKDGDSLTIGDYVISVAVHNPGSDAVTVESAAIEAEDYDPFRGAAHDWSEPADEDPFADAWPAAQESDRDPTTDQPPGLRNTGNDADWADWADGKTMKARRSGSTTAWAESDNAEPLSPTSTVADAADWQADLRPAATPGASTDAALPDTEISATDAAPATPADGLQIDARRPDVILPDPESLEPARVSKSRRPSIRRRKQAGRRATAADAPNAPAASLPATAEHADPVPSSDRGDEARGTHARPGASSMPAATAAPAAAPTSDAAAAAEVTTRRTPEPPGVTTSIGGAADAIDALLEETGIDPAAVAGIDREQLARHAGMILQIAVDGVLQLLHSRSALKQAMNSDVTRLAAAENNPLKFAACTEDALAMLLRGSAGQGYLGAEEAMQEALEDVRMHQLAMLEGMKAAVRHLLEEFDPSALESTLASKHPIAAVVPITREARLWSLFCEHYDDIRNAAMDDFHELFGREFRRAYEQRLHARQRRPTR